MNIHTATILSNAAADTTGEPQQVVVRGLTSVQAHGNFEGATVKLQTTLDGSTWFDVAELTAAGGLTTTLLAAVLRGVVVGGGENTSVTLRVSYMK